MALGIEGLQQILTTKQDYNKARGWFLKFTESDNLNAQALFQHAHDNATVTDPYRARSLGHLSFARLSAWRHGWTSNNQADIARALVDADNAVNENDTDYDNYWSRGAAKVINDPDGDGLADYELACDLFFLNRRRHGDTIGDFYDFLIEWSESLVLSGYPREAVRKIWFTKELSQGNRRERFREWVLGWACCFAGPGYFEVGESALNPFDRLPGTPYSARLDLAVILMNKTPRDRARAQAIVDEVRGADPSLTQTRERQRYRYANAMDQTWNDYLQVLGSLGVPA